MYVPKMIAGLGVGLVLGVGAVGTSFAAQMAHSSTPVGCASVPSGGGQPVGCASRPGNGYGDKNHVHTGAPAGCPPGLAKGHPGTPVGCASRPGNGYGDKNHVHTGAPGHPGSSVPKHTGNASKHHDAGSVRPTSAKPATLPVTPAHSPVHNSGPGVSSGSHGPGAPGHGKSGQHQKSGGGQD